MKTKEELTIDALEAMLTEKLERDMAKHFAKMTTMQVELENDTIYSDIRGGITVEFNYRSLGKCLSDVLYDTNRTLQQHGWDVITAALISSGDKELVKLGLERMKESDKATYYTA
jgi:hypothetical protein